MKKTLFILLLALPFGFTNAEDVEAVQKLPGHPLIEIVTSLGTIKLELDSRQAPLTVAHILALVDAGYYDGTIFHRVIPGFMAQGGGFTPNLKRKETEASDVTVPNESGNGMSNLRGTIAMARTGDPHSATTQFFINVADNIRLDPNKSANGTWGYTIFGIVIEGMDIVDKIVGSSTGPAGPFPRDVPNIPIIIKSMSQATYE